MMRCCIFIWLLLCIATVAAADPFAPDTGKAGMIPPGSDLLQLDAIAQPGPMHGLLSPFCGYWKTRVRIWESPDAPPREAEGTALATGALDGRYVLRLDTAAFSPRRYRSVFLIGYDNQRQGFEISFGDVRSTALFQGFGQPTDSTMRAIQFDNTATGSEKLAEGERLIFRLDTGNHQFIELFRRTPEGREYKALEIENTRLR